MIDLLKWDTDFLGFPVGLIRDVDNPENLNEHLDYFKQKGYRLVYFFANPNDEKVNHEALINKGLLTDIKVHYGLVMSDIIPEPDSENILIYNSSEPDEMLYKLALQSGEYSRFRTDIKFPFGSFEKLYKLWMLRSVMRIIADEVFVYQKEGLIKGVITVYQKSNVGNIGLLGVDILSRGEKIGTKLMTHTKNYFFQKKICKLEVVTQMANKSACAFYEKSGFNIIRTENIYHFWL